MSFALLPQELVDQVIDHLWDDKTQLKACTLASRSFSYTSQLHLFDNLYLNGQDTPDNHDLDFTAPSPSRFYDLVHNAPHLVPFVKHLELGFRSIVDPGLPRLLAVLTHVQSLIIEGPSEADENDSGYRGWEELTPDLKEALVAFFASQPLVSLRISTMVSLPTSLFRLCPGLTILEIHETLFDVDDVYREDIPPPFTKSLPTELSIDCSLQCDFESFLEPFAHPRSAVDITRLENLAVYVDSQDLRTYSMVQEVLQVNSATLRSLTFNPDHREEFGYNLNLSPLTSLNYLCFQFAFDVQSVHQPIPWLISILTTINSATLLELKVHIGLRKGLREQAISSPWDELDTLLVSPKFARLEKLNFYLEASQDLHSFVCDQVRSSLSLCACKGLLEVS